MKQHKYGPTYDAALIPWLKAITAIAVLIVLIGIYGQMTGADPFGKIAR